MKIAFRTDASSEIGTGHVVRCLTLALQMRRFGDTIFFICRELPGNLCGMIESFGFSVVRLKLGENKPQESFFTGDIEHAHWLGVTWETDANQTYECISLSDNLDWLIVDHYALDYRWEKTLKPLTRKLMVIDDLFDRKHEADLILNQNIIAEGSANYDNLVPENCNQLLGPRYALLREEYKILRAQTLPKSGKIKRLLISFGGVDSSNLTEKCLKALQKTAPLDIEIDVVMPMLGKHSNSIFKIAKGNNKIKLHKNIPSLSKLIARADLAVGAAGTTSWERLCLGLPSFLVTLASNQIEIARSLEANRLAVWLGHYDEVSEQLISEKFQEIFKNGYSVYWSYRCRNQVDGHGVNRVYENISNSFSDTYVARHTRLSDLSINFKGFEENNKSTELLEDREAFLIYHSGSLFSIISELKGIIGLVKCIKQKDLLTLKAYPIRKEKNLIAHDTLKAVAIKRLKADNEICSFMPPEDMPCAKQIVTVCTDHSSWINDFIPNWIVKWTQSGHKVNWLHNPNFLPNGDICFYLSLNKIVSKSLRNRHHHNLVVHESDLPEGRGWSPLTWQVLSGLNAITVSLIEAKDSVDSGKIYSQTEIKLNGSELVDQIRKKQAAATFKLCNGFIIGFPETEKKSRKQKGTPTYFKKRTPKNSELDISKTIASQFNLLRVCDNERYPAWFKYKGKKFSLHINQLEEKNDKS